MLTKSYQVAEGAKRFHEDRQIKTEREGEEKIE